jgi:hypothetical protein
MTTFDDPNDPGIIQVDPEWVKFIIIRGTVDEILDLTHCPGIHAVRLPYLYGTVVELLTTIPAQLLPFDVYTWSNGRILLDP